MYEVVICTVSSGRVQRLRFNDSDTAWACADKWSAKNRSSRTYLVTVETVAPTRVAQPTIGRAIGRTASM